MARLVLQAVHNIAQDCPLNLDLNKGLEACKAMAEEISAFFKENGGMGNGYETTCEGRIARNVSGFLKVRVPDPAEKMTKKDTRLLSEALEKILKALIPPEFPPHYCFWIRSEHVEWGAYDTFVTLDYSVKVKL